MGAPKHNVNRAAHGLRACRLPRGCGYVAKEASRFRKSLETAVADVYGSVDLRRAAAIDEALKWHTHSLLASRWLRREGANLDGEAQLRFSRAAADAAAARNRIVSELLPKDAILANLYKLESAWDS